MSDVHLKKNLTYVNMLTEIIALFASFKSSKQLPMVEAKLEMVYNKKNKLVSVTFIP